MSEEGMKLACSRDRHMCRSAVPCSLILHQNDLVRNMTPGLTSVPVTSWTGMRVGHVAVSDQATAGGSALGMFSRPHASVCKQGGGDEDVHPYMSTPGCFIQPGFTATATMAGALTSGRHGSVPLSNTTICTPPAGRHSRHSLFDSCRMLVQSC